MAELPDPLDALVRLLMRLPGIGRRSAQRLAYHFARVPDDSRALAAALRALPDQLGICSVCGNLSAGAICSICVDPRRDRGVVCVVQQPENLAAIERTGVFHGVYHVLGGAISPLRSVGPEDLSISQLEARGREGEIREAILATNPTVEGEATALYVAHVLAPLGIRVTRPAMGLPVGGELEYVDQVTLSRALEGRRDLT